MPLIPGLDFAAEHLHVAYRGSLEPQELSLDIQTSGKARQMAGPPIIAAFMRAVNLGAAGSDDFPPSAGHAELVSGPWKEPEALGPDYHYVLRVAGVSPRSLRTLVESLATIGHRGRRTTAVRIHGSLPVDGTPLSATETDVRSWLDDRTSYTRRWPKVPFPVTSVDAPGVDIRVVVAKVDARVREAFEGMCIWWLNVVQDYVASDGRPVDLSSLRQRFPRIGRTGNELTARFTEFLHDRPPAKDALINMLVRFHETVAPIVEAEIGMSGDGPRAPAVAERNPKARPSSHRAPKKPRRGVALVDDVIARITRDGGLVDGAAPRPLPPSRLARLRFPDGRPLPPSLARWLAFDAAWVGLFDKLLRPRWRAGPLSSLVQRAFGSWGEAFARDIDPHLPAPGLLLPIGTESCRILYLGEPDDLGEYPVLYVDVDDLPAVGLLAPGFDGYLALAFGLWPAQGTYGQVPPAYEPSMKLHADRFFDGLRERELGEPNPPPRPTGPAIARLSPPAVDWFDVAAVGALEFSDVRLAGPLAPAPGLPAAFGATTHGTPAACLSAFESFSAAQRAAKEPYFVDVEREGATLHLHGLFDESAFTDVAAPLVRLALTASAGELVLFVMQGPKPVTAYRVRDHQVLEVGREELREIAASEGVHEVYARQQRP